MQNLLGKNSWILGKVFTPVFFILSDAALYYQFDRYLEGDNVSLAEILENTNKLKEYGEKFLQDVYPNIDTAPTELINWNFQKAFLDYLSWKILFHCRAV